MIYIIGGVARSGKSSIRKYILNEYKISGIETDSIRTMLELSMSELGIHYNNKPMINAEKMSLFISSLVKSRLFFSEDYVIEGDCVLPESVAEFKNNKNIKMLFIGYPEANLKEKFEQLCAEREGWLKNITDNDLIEKIKQFIADSAFIRDGADKYKLPFLDSSNLSLKQTIDGALKKLGFIK